MKQASQISKDNIGGRFNMENGAVGDDQLIWLKEELEKSVKLGGHVIIYDYCCLSPGSCAESSPMELSRSESSFEYSPISCFVPEWPLPHR